MSIDEKLYINDKLVYLLPRSVGLTLLINDIADIKDRNAHYSNNIKIPKTSENILTFELLGLTGNTTRIPYEQVSVKYILNGIELISKGKGILKNTNKFYNLVIYAGNISMVDLLGEKQLNTLDFSSYNHSLTSSVWTSSFVKTSGYIYALSRYYVNASTNTFNIDLNSPSFFVHTLFNMIFSQEGYTISGDIFTNIDYKSRVISMNKGFNREVISNLTFKKSVNTMYSVSESYNDPTTKEYEIDSYITNESGVHEITLTGSTTINRGNNPFFRFRVNGQIAVASVSIPIIAYNIEKSLNVESGDTISVHVLIDTELVASDYIINFAVNHTQTIFLNNKSIVINFNDLIGETKRIDFVKEIIQRFGLMFRKTQHENNFEFIQMEELLVDKVSEEDWTDKFSNVINENYKSVYAKENYFKTVYDSDSTEVVDTFGDGVMIIEDENLQSTKTILTSIFKSSVLINNRFYILNHWIDEEEEEIIQQEDGLRIFRILNVTDSISYQFETSAGSPFNFTGTIALYSFIGYQNELSAYYSKFKKILNNYKKITIECNLSIIDIYELDFFKLKYFKNLGKTFYLNKVSNFRSNKKTKCEFIQVDFSEISSLSLVGVVAGSSVYSGTIIKLGFGSMTGNYNGSSTYLATLRLITVTSFDMSDSGVIETLVCSEYAGTEHWHDGAGTFPTINDMVFTNSGGTIVKNGGDLYFVLPDDNYIKINSSGVVITKTVCEEGEPV